MLPRLVLYQTLILIKIFLGGGGYRNSKTDDNGSQYGNDAASISSRGSKPGSGRYSRSLNKTHFNSRAGRSAATRKSKDDAKHDEYQDYPADYLTCPVRMNALVTGVTE